jgi:hypothetical protein
MVPDASIGIKETGRIVFKNKRQLPLPAPVDNRMLKRRDADKMTLKSEKPNEEASLLNAIPPRITYTL